MTHSQETNEPRGLMMVAQGQSVPQISYWELNQNNPNWERRAALKYGYPNRIARFISYVRRLFHTQKK